jgi:hypothetical protein
MRRPAAYLCRIFAINVWYGMPSSRPRFCNESRAFLEILRFTCLPLMSCECMRDDDRAPPPSFDRLPLSSFKGVERLLLFLIEPGHLLFSVRGTSSRPCEERHCQRESRPRFGSQQGIRAHGGERHRVQRRGQHRHRPLLGAPSRKPPLSPPAAATLVRPSLPRVAEWLRWLDAAGESSGSSRPRQCHNPLQNSRE